MKKIFLNLMLLLGFVGCGGTSIHTLKGKEFVLNNSNTTISFDEVENRFYGKAVNNYFGEYIQNGDNISLNLQGSTMMLGPKDEMKAETKYFNDLNQITTHKIEGNTLTLKGNKVDLIFTRKYL